MPPEVGPWGHAAWLAPGLDNRSAFAHMTPLGHDDDDLQTLKEVIETPINEPTPHTGRIWWPPVGSSHGRQRAVLTAVSGQFSRPPLGRTRLIGKFGEGLPVKLDRA
jgi:hypothetical protein